MFIYYLDLLHTDFLLFLSFAGAVTLALLGGIAFHEFCHALSATALGDTTAKRMGRLTLNPMAHLDPFGTLLLFIAGFGWGKPVPVNTQALRNGRMGMAMVAAAGPLSNLLLAAVLAVPIRLGLADWHSPFAVISSTAFWTTGDYVGLFLSAGILLNVILAVFNFIPLAPLDGFKVALGLLPADIARPIAEMERYGMVILMGIFFLGPMVGFNFFDLVVRPAVETIAGALLGV